MNDIIILIIIVAVVGLAIAKVIKEKKAGAVCVGCSVAGKCKKKNCDH